MERGAVAQLYVILSGRLLLDRCFGCQPASLFWIFSASKPYPAILIHLLAERGKLSLDDPVVAHWPEFARHGKDTITIRHVLQHRTGLPVAGSGLGEVLAMSNWQRSIRRIENAHPLWHAGVAPGYQPLTYGFILGEIVRRITGSEIQQALAREILEPMQARDTYLGLPDEQWPRHVPISARGPAGSAVEFVVNRRFIRNAVIPAAGISTTARDLAAFYLMLLRGGISHGTRILQPATIEQARQPSSDGEIDRCVKAPIRWSQGFQLGGPRPNPANPSPLGRLSNPRTFGHNGSNCCIGWADPDRNLVVAYLTNRLNGRKPDIQHLAGLADAIIRACDGD